MSDSNSDQRPKKPDKEPKNFHLPRQRQAMPNEADLWNLDEELPAARVKPADELPSSSPYQPEPSAPETITRIESPDARRRARKAAKARETASPEEESESAPPVKPGLNPLAVLPKSAPSGLGMTEDEIWSDFIDDEPSPAPMPPSSKMAEVKAMPEPASESDAKVPPLSPEPLAPIPAETWETTPEPPAVTQEEIAEKDSQNSENKEAEPESFEPPAPGSHSKSWQITRFSRLETMLSLAFLLLLIGGGFWGAQIFRQQVQTQADPYTEPEFPAKGALALIESAETYWRPPVKEGPDADPTQREVILIPVIDITLGSCAAPSGVIRVLFYNDKGEIVGDTITRPYRDSRFVSTDSSTASFPSTTGFTSFGEQEAYRAYLGKPWSIRVYEGPDETASSSAFKLLFTTPISTKRQ
jgi:hypothetical protein